MDKSIPMSACVKEKFFNEQELAVRIKEIGTQITEDFKDKQNDGITIICVVKGAVLFMADLIRNIDLTLSVDFVSASSYGNSHESSGEVSIETFSSSDFSGRHIIIAEDIVDSGLTLHSLVDYLYNQGARSVTIAALLDKHKSKYELPVNYVCFDCPDEFIVGYGLDFMQDYRNLPYVGVMKDEYFKEMLANE